MKEKMSSTARLMKMPEVFSLQYLRTEGFSEEYAKIIINTWKKKGFVKSAGPRLGVYYNLIKDQKGPEEHLGKVLKIVFGSVVVIGPTILHQYGWITQIPQTLTVAIPESRSYPMVDGVTLYGRHSEWFGRIYQVIHHKGKFSLPSLTAPWAFADAIQHQDCLHHLSPDDIEIPSSTKPSLIRNALENLEVSPDIYMPYINASDIDLETNEEEPEIKKDLFFL